MNPLPSLTAATAWRRQNLGYLLFSATALCIRDKLRVVHRAGFDSITDAQSALFQNLDLEGSRLTALSARAGLAKQSMIELVDKAQRLGLIERSPDPADRRAKLVRLSPDGVRLLGKLRQGIGEAEQGFARVSGEPRLHSIKRELIGYALRDAAAPILGSPARDGGWRSNNIERVLADAARQFVREVLGAVHQHGYRDVNEALLALFRNLELDGSRLTDVATAALMTKQSMRELVDRAERLGYVERGPDPSDGRAKTIRFNSAGLTMLEAMRGGVSEAEAQFAQSTNTGFLLDLKQTLNAYILAGRSA